MATVDERALAANVARWMTTPLTGLVVLGSNGEAAQLEDDEADRVVEIVRAGVPSSRPLIAGTGRESTRATIAATRRAAAAGAGRGAGAHAIVLQAADDVGRVRPSLHRSRGRIAGAGALVQRHALHRRQPAARCRRASRRSSRTSSGIKESGSDIGQIAEYVARTPDDFTVLAGSATTLVHALLRGMRRRDSGAGLARAGRVRARC